MIEFENFSFTYQGDIIATLKNINLKINKGDCVIITGLSGCGKTTLLRVINGLCPSVFCGVSNGNFKTDFYDYKDSSASSNSKYVGSILQNPKNSFLFPNAEDECKYSAKCICRSREEISFEFSNLKAKYENLLSHEDILKLSSGESQILSILSSKLKKSKIIIMDEPTANLDITEIAELKKNIVELKKSGITIVIAEHRIGYLKDICDKVYIMQNGELKNDENFEFRSQNITFSRLTTIQNNVSKDHLDILNLSYKVKSKKILENINLSIKSGRVTAIVGKNGSGKSTLGKCIAGLLDSKKTIFALNNVILSKKDRLKNSYFCMQDTYHQMVTATVREEILLQNENLNDEEISYFLDLIDMKDFENRHPSKLSGGQSLRLAVLLAYISNNKIVILDEPTSGLDFKRMKLICNLIKKMRTEGRIVILISHDLELLSQVSDEYILLEMGKLMEHKKLENQVDFENMVFKISKKEEIKYFSDESREKSSMINPIVNLLTFFTISNAIFFYPYNQSSTYLMLLIGVILLLNQNYKLFFKMTVSYFIVAKLKAFCPIYYQIFIEVFVLRGMMCGYALKNITVNTKLIEMIESLEKIKLTDYILIPIISLIRLFPTMAYDSSVSYMSLKTRKLIRNKNPVLIWKFLLVPTVFSLIRSAENLSCGIETKGMSINKKRTILTNVKFKITDYIVLAMYLSMYTILILGGIKWITN